MWAVHSIMRAILLCRRKELLALAQFLCLFKQYLLVRQFCVRINHAPSSWFRCTSDSLEQQARWLEEVEVLEEYDLTIELWPGNRHANADALWHRVCPKKDCMSQLSPSSPSHPQVSRSEVRDTVTASDEPVGQQARVSSVFSEKTYHIVSARSSFIV
jgi:RNase H-like domain found in reverse transcriptase